MNTEWYPPPEMRVPFVSKILGAAAFERIL
jgi:hypothetical protein